MLFTSFGSGYSILFGEHGSCGGRYIVHAKANRQTQFGIANLASDKRWMKEAISQITNLKLVTSESKDLTVINCNC